MLAFDSVFTLELPSFSSVVFFPFPFLPFLPFLGIN